MILNNILEIERTSFKTYETILIKKRRNKQEIEPVK